MPRHLISDAHEWMNDIPTVPISSLANPQPRERAWRHQRGKKTLLSLTLVWLCQITLKVERKWESVMGLPVALGFETPLLEKLFN